MLPRGPANGATPVFRSDKFVLLTNSHCHVPGRMDSGKHRKLAVTCAAGKRRSRGRDLPGNLAALRARIDGTSPRLPKASSCQRDRLIEIAHDFGSTATSVRRLVSRRETSEHLVVPGNELRHAPCKFVLGACDILLPKKVSAVGDQGHKEPTRESRSRHQDLQRSGTMSRAPPSTCRIPVGRDCGDQPLSARRVGRGSCGARVVVARAKT